MRPIPYFALRALVVILPCVLSCGGLDIRMSSGGSGGTGGSGGRSAESASSQAEKITSMPEAELVPLLVDQLLGKSSLDPNDGEGYAALVARFAKLAERGGSDRALPPASCADAAMNEDPDLTPASAAERCQDETTGDIRTWLSEGEPARRAAAVELLLGHMPAGAERQAKAEALVQSIGFEAKHAPRGGYTLEPVAEERWSDAHVRFAVRLAKRLQLSALATHYAALRKPLGDCRLAIWSVEKPYVGGGKYGPMTQGDVGWLARTNLKLTDYASCADAKKGPTDGALLAWARTVAKQPNLLVSARFHKDSPTWEVVKNRYGTPLAQRRVAVVYSRRASR